MTYPNATITKKANVYYDGDVTSRTVQTIDGETVSLGFMQAGTYTFNTTAAECMDIQHGECRVKLAGEEQWHIFSEGNAFKVPSNSSFDIEVADFLDYICHYED